MTIAQAPTNPNVARPPGSPIPPNPQFSRPPLPGKGATTGGGPVNPNTVPPAIPSRPKGPRAGAAGSQPQFPVRTNAPTSGGPSALPGAGTAANPSAAASPGAGATAAPALSDPANADEEIDLQFPNTPLPEILAIYEDLTGKKIIRDINVEGATISIETTGKLPKSEAIEFIEKSLLLNGYTFIPSGEKMLKFVAYDAKKPISEGGMLTVLDETKLPASDQIVNYVLKLQYLEPEDAVKIINDLVPAHSYGKLGPVPNSRAIIITENSATVKQIIDLMKSLDVEPSKTEQRSFQLTRENAEDVQKALEEILDTGDKKSGGSSGGSGYTGGAAAPRPTTAPQLGGQPGSSIPGQPAGMGAAAARSAVVSSIDGGSASVPPKIIAVPRTNRLLVIARPVDMVTIEKLIEELDAAAELRNFVIRKLKYLPVSQAMGILGDAITRGNDKNGGATTGGGNLTSSGTQTNQTTSPFNTGYGSGSSGFGRSGTGSSGFGSSGFGSSGFGSGGFGGGGGLGGGGMGAANLQALRQEEGLKSMLVGKTLLIADSNQNEIFASGPPDHLQVLNEILDEIDVRPEQILISVVIGEVTLADGVEFGLDWLLRPTEIRLNENQGLVAGALRNTGSTILDPPAIESVADLAEIGNGLTLYGTINDHVNVIVNALKSNTAFKVISRPSVFTLNNKPATISSGTSIPVPTQTFSSFNTGVDGNTGITSNIAYQDIALSLSVVPLINSDDELTLQIAQQNNEQSGTTTINGNPYPTISSQQVSTVVMVKDQATVLLGGLIRENVQKERSGIPILSSIPIIKYLAGSKKERTTRRELLVFIQPRIVRGEGDLPPNVDDNAGQSPFAKETKDFLKQEQSAPPEPVKSTRIGRLIDRLLR